MKKLLSAILAAMLLLSLTLPAWAEDATGLVYIYGGASNKNRAKLKNMGQQSWYMMYSTQINAGEEIDLASFKECVQSETGMWLPGETVELPNTAPDAEEGSVTTCTGSWFSIRKDGLIAPDTGFSAGLKWVCEKDATYDLEIGYSGGTSAGYPEEGYFDPLNGYWVPAADGVYMSMWIRRADAEAPEMIFIVDTWEMENHTMAQTDITKTGVELKAGDEIWLVCDSKANGGWDSPWWCVSITEVQ